MDGLIKSYPIRVFDIQTTDDLPISLVALERLHYHVKFIYLYKKLEFMICEFRESLLSRSEDWKGVPGRGLKKWQKTYDGMVYDRLWDIYKFDLPRIRWDMENYAIRDLEDRHHIGRFSVLSPFP